MTWPNRLVLVHCDDDGDALPSGYDVNLAVAMRLLRTDYQNRKFHSFFFFNISFENSLVFNGKNKRIKLEMGMQIRTILQSNNQLVLYGLGGDGNRINIVCADTMFAHFLIFKIYKLFVEIASI